MKFEWNSIERARWSLEGLRVGDAFGELFFGADGDALSRIGRRELPSRPWRWTDDTALAKVLVGHLERHQKIRPHRLASEWADEYTADPLRGYGGQVGQALTRIAAGEPFEAVSQQAFGGEGSWGNGACMRVGPLGAYFCDDPGVVKEMAFTQAHITHRHSQAIVGAQLVALAAAWFWTRPEQGLIVWLLEQLSDLDRDWRHRLLMAQSFCGNIKQATELLGNGAGCKTIETVPFCLWCLNQAAARPTGPSLFEETLWMTVEGLGDRDTTCAIVASVIASPMIPLPQSWLDNCESI